MDTYKVVMFQIANNGGIRHHCYVPDDECETRPYMRVYRLCKYELNLTSQYLCDHMSAFSIPDFENMCFHEHHFSKLASYTENFEDVAYPIWGTFPCDKGPTTGTYLGFIFKSPRDAAMFKIICEFPTTVSDYDASFIC